jgi:hypothetical protein
MNALKRIPIKYLSAAGIGLTFWFFFDTMGDASSLDVNNSLYPTSLFGGWSHVAVIIVFAAGLATLAIIDHFAVPRPTLGEVTQAPSRNVLFLIPVAVAFVMGIHGLGEGWDAASAVAGAQITTGSLVQTLIQAFGDIAAVVSYPMHKFLEAAIIGIVYTIYVVRTGGGMSKRWWQIPVLGLLFGATSVIGSALGYYISFDTIYFYAFGVTSALYAAIRLAEPITSGFQDGKGGPAYLGGKVFLAMGIGFFLLYTAALLH